MLDAREKKGRIGWGKRWKLGWVVQHSGFELERCDVDDDFGTRLENDEEHVDRVGNTVKVEVIVYCNARA
jgi:hypothetical protein